MLLEEMLAKEEEDIKKLSEDSRSLPIDFLDNNTNKQRKANEEMKATCLLQIWLEDPDKKKEILDNPELIAADIFSFVFAAFTNSYAVLAWTIWELLTEKERQKEEITKGIKTKQKIPSINN